MERVRRVELLSPVWKTEVLTAIRNPHIWCARRGSNPRPCGPKPHALIQLSYGRPPKCLVILAQKARFCYNITMKVIKRQQASEYTNGNCSGFEFDLGTKELDGAVVHVTTRFPAKGRVVNEGCREIAYVVDGSGQIVIENNTYEISQDDLIVIDTGEKFYWNGNFKLFVYCTPAWFPEQHKQVE